MADVKPTDTIIDVACGTGDLTIKFAKKLFRLNNKKEDKFLGKSSYLISYDQKRPPKIIGLDFTFEMLPIAQRKGPEIHWHGVIDNALAHGKEPVIDWINGNALALPLPNASMDILSIAFGIRNVSNWQNAITEFARVLKPGGRLIILEFSLPTNPIMRAFYNFYFKKIMPHTATLISGDKSGAYKYLPQSVNTFISREAMQNQMKTAGFTNVIAKPMTFGICICYKGIKQ